jgi:hypothetical protein
VPNERPSAFLAARLAFWAARHLLNLSSSWDGAARRSDSGGGTGGSTGVDGGRTACGLGPFGGDRVGGGGWHVDIRSLVARSPPLMVSSHHGDSIE